MDASSPDGHRSVRNRCSREARTTIRERRHGQPLRTEALAPLSGGVRVVVRKGTVRRSYHSRRCAVDAVVPGHDTDASYVRLIGNSRQCFQRRNPIQHEEKLLADDGCRAASDSPKRLRRNHGHCGLLSFKPSVMMPCRNRSQNISRRVSRSLGYRAAAAPWYAKPVPRSAFEPSRSLRTRAVFSTSVLYWLLPDN